MFCGEYSHNLDSKKRISLPARLRDELGENVVMTKNVDRCISLYPAERWQTFTAKLDSLPDIETRQVKRFLYSAAFETNVDGQGRLLVSPTLCAYAELDRAVKVIGVGDHIEIWDEARWNEENSSENTADITALLIKLGF
ncbi:MAG: division/cell wall cluster transcriptional repressor MraZ [Ruminococcaceae bacterium]|nr:division/cell wall cluster transcriptional repressor MraZ [Oscillospiraceae bacterium]